MAIDKYAGKRSTSLFAPRALLMPLRTLISSWLILPSRANLLLSTTLGIICTRIPRDTSIWPINSPWKFSESSRTVLVDGLEVVEQLASFVHTRDDESLTSVF